MDNQQQQGPTPAPGAANPEAPDARNPQIGIGDALKFFQALSEAVLTGKTEVPVMHFKVAGKHVDLGPAPVRIS